VQGALALVMVLLEEVDLVEEVVGEVLEAEEEVVGRMKRSIEKLEINYPYFACHSIISITI
jgi:hypothetical protein